MKFHLLNGGSGVYFFASYRRYHTASNGIVKHYITNRIFRSAYCLPSAMDWGVADKRHKFKSHFYDVCHFNVVASTKSTKRDFQCARNVIMYYFFSRRYLLLGIWRANRKTVLTKELYAVVIAMMPRNTHTYASRSHGRIGGSVVYCRRLFHGLSLHLMLPEAVLLWSGK